jgi:uncharacterized membrane protein
MTRSSDRSKPSRSTRHTGKAERAFHWLDPRGAGQRLLFALACGAAAWAATPARFSPATHALIAWVVGGGALLVVAFAIIVHADVEETRRRAAARDPGRTAVWLVVLGCSTLSLFAATSLVNDLKSVPAGEASLRLVLGVVTVVVAWCLTHTAFTLRYAHLFYRGAGSGGLEFPGGEAPDDLDFAYFAFTIGMCFQVSDSVVTSRQIRRTALAHAVLSFGYNTGILALVLNIVMGQLG